MSPLILLSTFRNVHSFFLTKCADVKSRSRMWAFIPPKTSTFKEIADVLF